MQFSGNFKGKTPILSKFWAQAPPLGSKLLSPLTKILDPRLETKKEKQIHQLTESCPAMRAPSWAGCLAAVAPDWADSHCNCCFQMWAYCFRTWSKCTGGTSDSCCWMFFLLIQTDPLNQRERLWLGNTFSFLRAAHKRSLELIHGQEKEMFTFWSMPTPTHDTIWFAPDAQTHANKQRWTKILESFVFWKTQCFGVSFRQKTDDGCENCLPKNISLNVRTINPSELLS